MEESPLEFPADHEIKIMGRSSTEFRSRMAAVLVAELGPAGADRIRERPSRDGTFVSLTCTVYVESRLQLDGLYQALHRTGLVLYAL